MENSSNKKNKNKIPCLAYHSCCLVIPTELKEDPSFTIYKRIPEVKLKTINVKELGLYIF